MNRLILLLNVAVLVVNFFLSLTATDSQIALMHSASATANARVPRQGLAHAANTSAAYLRVVQGLEGFAPAEAITAERLRAIHEAVGVYRETVVRGVRRALAEPGSLRQAHAAIGREARAEVQRTLAPHFPDAGLARRLTTEVIRACGS